MIRTKNEVRLIKVCKRNKNIFDAKGVKKRKAAKAFGMLLIMVSSILLGFKYVQSRDINAQAKMETKTPDLKASQIAIKKDPIEMKSVKPTPEAPMTAGHRSISISRSWIGGELKRKIKTKAFAMVALEDSYLYVDDKGNALDTIKEITQVDLLPIISGPWREKKISDLLPADGHIWKSGAQLAQSIKHSGISYSDISELHYDQLYGWQVHLISPRTTVVFGKENLSKKTDRLEKILHRLNQRSKYVRSIDLDYREIAIIKFNQGNRSKDGQS